MFVLVHITSAIVGIAFCWSTPVSPKLEDLEDNPLGFPLSTDQSSWLASLVSLGAAVGPFAGGYLSDSIGRKRTLLATCVLAIISFALLAFGNNLYIYYVARFLGGICVGTLLTVVPMYIGEIAEIHNRGTLGGLCAFFGVSGQLYCFVVGPYTSTQIFSLSCMIFPALFLIMGILFVPESPCYLIMKGKNDTAKRSLKKLRCSRVIDEELMDLTITVKESLATNGGILDIIKAKHLCKALSITAGLMIIQQFTAISAVLFYMQGIFENAGSSLPKEIATIIVGLVQVIATFSSSVLVDRLGRRPLLIGSAVATCFTLFTLSFYFYLQTIFDVSCIAWLPIVALIVYIFFFNVGMGPLPLTLLGEMFPPHVKSAASSITIACCFFFSFVAAKVFPILASSVDNWFAFLVFGLGNAFGIVFIWYQVPETKGKSLVEILESLK